MLCKAAVMGDFDSFGAIAKANEPRTVKALGRKVRYNAHCLAKLYPHPTTYKVWYNVHCLAEL